MLKTENTILKAKEAVEKLANTPVIGGIPRNEAIKVEERHLGLVPAVERENILQSIEKWGTVYGTKCGFRCSNIYNEKFRKTIKGKRTFMGRGKWKKELKLELQWMKSLHFITKKI